MIERELKTVSERYTTDAMYIKTEMVQMENGGECRKKKNRRKERNVHVEILQVFV